MKEDSGRGKLLAYYAVVTGCLMIFLVILGLHLLIAWKVDRQLVMSMGMVLILTGYVFRRSHRTYFIHSTSLRMYTLAPLVIGVADYVLSFRK
jgi:hypothetical protein